ncbi:imelysin family protein [Hahella aquimaris]|uniref:imelysin family protein n=1 Tax=Hahella sp. HNIBRBA332 TaxID=3015983 RepID=UPI00273BB61A|nr:imelysin family protein [Hahella sp. HNIBRBA332]WLQ14005.1 imelysin family protein [Hahella sp. HNIBRBA332]
MRVGGRHIAIQLFLLCIALTACDKSTERNSPTESSAPQQSATPLTAQEQADAKATAGAVVSPLWSAATEKHDVALHAIEKLNRGLQQFISAPTPDSLKDAREDWMQAHAALQELKVWSQLPAAKNYLKHKAPGAPYNRASLLDAAPLLGGYLDEVPGYPKSGLTYAEDLEIGDATLSEQHQFADEYYLVYGMHPIEFMLWSHSDPAQQSARFIANADAPDTERRRELLRLQGERLLQEMTEFTAAWRPPSGSIFLKGKSMSQMEAVREANPWLIALIDFIDREVVSALKPKEGEPGWRFQEHLEFSQDAAHFWRGRMKAMQPFLTEPALFTDAQTRNSLKELRLKLEGCLTALSATAEDNQEQIAICENQALQLREQIIIRFAGN